MQPMVSVIFLRKSSRMRSFLKNRALERRKLETTAQRITKINLALGKSGMLHILRKSLNREKFLYRASIMID
jgi:hypothetical protein